MLIIMLQKYLFPLENRSTETHFDVSNKEIPTLKMHLTTCVRLSPEIKFTHIFKNTIHNVRNSSNIEAVWRTTCW